MNILVFALLVISPNILTSAYRLTDYLDPGSLVSDEYDDTEDEEDTVSKTALLPKSTKTLYHYSITHSLPQDEKRNGRKLPEDLFDVSTGSETFQQTSSKTDEGNIKQPRSTDSSLEHRNKKQPKRDRYAESYETEEYYIDGVDNNEPQQHERENGEYVMESEEGVIRDLSKEDLRNEPTKSKKTELKWYSGNKSKKLASSHNVKESKQAPNRQWHEYDYFDDEEEEPVDHLALLRQVNYDSVRTQDKKNYLKQKNKVRSSKLKESDVVKVAKDKVQMEIKKSKDKIKRRKFLKKEAAAGKKSSPISDSSLQERDHDSVVWSQPARVTKIIHEQQDQEKPKSKKKSKKPSVIHADEIEHRSVTTDPVLENAEAADETIERRDVVKRRPKKVSISHHVDKPEVKHAKIRSDSFYNRNLDRRQSPFDSFPDHDSKDIFGDFGITKSNSFFTSTPNDQQREKLLENSFDHFGTNKPSLFTHEEVKRPSLQEQGVSFGVNRPHGFSYTLPNRDQQESYPQKNFGNQLEKRPFSVHTTTPQKNPFQSHDENFQKSRPSPFSGSQIEKHQNNNFQHAGFENIGKHGPSSFSISSVPERKNRNNLKDDDSSEDEKVKPFAFDHNSHQREQFHEQGTEGQNSYKFGYSTGDKSNPMDRYEERDADGYVRGQYSFIDAHGRQQVIRYESHPEHGFRTLGSHGSHAGY